MERVGGCLVVFLLVLGCDKEDEDGELGEMDAMEAVEMCAALTDAGSCRAAGDPDGLHCQWALVHEPVEPTANDDCPMQSVGERCVAVNRESMQLGCGALSAYFRPGNPPEMAGFCAPLEVPVGWSSCADGSEFGAPAACSCWVPEDAAN